MTRHTLSLVGREQSDLRVSLVSGQCKAPQEGVGAGQGAESSGPDEGAKSSVPSQKQAYILAGGDEDDVDRVAMSAFSQ